MQKSEAWASVVDRKGEFLVVLRHRFVVDRYKKHKAAKQKKNQWNKYMPTIAVRKQTFADIVAVGDRMSLMIGRLCVTHSEVMVEAGSENPKRLRQDWEEIKHADGRSAESSQSS